MHATAAPAGGDPPGRSVRSRAKIGPTRCALAHEGLDAHVATTTILIGAVSNTIVKAGLAAMLGGWAVGRLVLIACIAMLVAAMATGAALWAVA